MDVEAKCRFGYQQPLEAKAAIDLEDAKTPGRFCRDATIFLFKVITGNLAKN